MVVKHIPEDGTNFIEYSVRKNNLDLNDGDTVINLAKRERDDDVHIDFCFDYTGMLINGTADAKNYVAQVDIPARKYTDEEVDNPDYDPDQEESSENRKTIIKHEAVPFSMDNVTLTLWAIDQEV